MSQALVVTHWVDLSTLYRGGVETVKYQRYNAGALENAEVSVEISPHTYPGQCYYFQFQGNVDRVGATRGHACVVLNARPHSFFRLVGADLGLTLDLTPQEAQTGFEHVVELLDGSPLVIRNANGLQSSSQELFYPGFGFWNPYDGTYGCLKVDFSVVFRPVTTALLPGSYQGSPYPADSLSVVTTVSLGDTVSYSSHRWSSLSSEGTVSETGECGLSATFALNGEVLMDRLSVCEQENSARCEIVQARERAQPSDDGSLSTVILDHHLEIVQNSDILDTIFGTSRRDAPRDDPFPSATASLSPVSSEAYSPGPRPTVWRQPLSIDEILTGSQSTLRRARRRFTVELPPLALERSSESDADSAGERDQPSVPPNSPIDVDLSRLFTSITVPEFDVSPTSMPSVVRRASYTPPADNFDCDLDEVNFLPDIIRDDILEPVNLPIFSPIPNLDSRYCTGVSPDWLRRSANQHGEARDYDYDPGLALLQTCGGFKPDIETSQEVSCPEPPQLEKPNNSEVGMTTENRPVTPAPVTPAPEVAPVTPVPEAVEVLTDANGKSGKNKVSKPAEDKGDSCSVM